MSLGDEFAASGKIKGSYLTGDPATHDQEFEAPDLETLRATAFTRPDVYGFTASGHLYYFGTVLTAEETAAAYGDKLPGGPGVFLMQAEIIGITHFVSTRGEKFFPLEDPVMTVFDPRDGRTVLWPLRPGGPRAGPAPLPP